MGRRKLYFTAEERLAAGREQSRQYYSRNREAVCEAKRAKYDLQKTPSKSPLPAPLPATEEERKLKNRLKSQRYYDRMKSVIKARRNGKQVNATKHSARSSDAPLRRRLDRDSWEQRLVDLKAELPKALSYQDAKAYLETLATRYLTSGSQAVIDDAYTAFDALHTRVITLQNEVYTSVGACACMSDAMTFAAQVDQLVELLEDLYMAIGEGRASFLMKYTKRELLYQRKLR